MKPLRLVHLPVTAHCKKCGEAMQFDLRDYCSHICLACETIHTYQEMVRSAQSIVQRCITRIES